MKEVLVKRRALEEISRLIGISESESASRTENVLVSVSHFPFGSTCGILDSYEFRRNLRAPTFPSVTLAFPLVSHKICYRRF